jgi:lipid-binding SYLF domain-containing protein
MRDLAGQRRTPTLPSPRGERARTSIIVRASDYKYADNKLARNVFIESRKGLLEGILMNKAIKQSARHAVVALAAIVLSSAGAHAQEKNAKRLAEATRHAQQAADAFTEIMNVADKAIPQSLLDKADAIAVFPNVIKAGFIVGGRGGYGVISRRGAGGWSAPAFFNLGGGSIGLQIGASKTDFVLLFMNEEALNGLLKDKFEIGGEGSVAAGPVGRAASASTDAQLKAGILSYSRSKGIFAGLEIKGVVINPDNDDNVAVYGKKAGDILAPTQRWKLTGMPAGVRIFPRTLARYSTPK